MSTRANGGAKGHAVEPADAGELREGALVAKRFRLVRPLSRGGMGSVWIAHHTTLGTEIALKFVDVSGEGRSEALRRFEKEATVVARLRSPNVVQILDYGVDEAQRPYLAMELLTGESLRERLAREPRLPVATVTRIVLQVCRALHRAHKVGVVHRDIKPGNLFLCEDDEGFLVKVLDFGIAKASLAGSDDQQTATGAIVGTPAYMSPEQVLGSVDLDQRSDIFSLAMVAWRALVGRHPHEPDGQPVPITELLIAIATLVVPKPSSEAPAQAIPPALDAWFARALALEREGRFASAREMAEALTAAVDDVASPFATGPFPSIADTGDILANLRAEGERPSTLPRTSVPTASAVVVGSGDERDDPSQSRTASTRDMALDGASPSQPGRTRTGVVALFALAALGAIIVVLATSRRAEDPAPSASPSLSATPSAEPHASSPTATAQSALPVIPSSSAVAAERGAVPSQVPQTKAAPPSPPKRVTHGATSLPSATASSKPPPPKPALLDDRL